MCNKSVLDVKQLVNVGGTVLPMFKQKKKTNLSNKSSHCIVTQIQPLNNACCYGKHVLERPTDLYAGHICGGVHPHVGAGKQLLHISCQIGILCNHRSIYMRGDGSHTP